MIYKLFKKCKNLVCFLVAICILIPIVGGCTKADNGLKQSIKNAKVGVGGNINAYTTYSQAKFMEMDRDMYYSYLLNMRDFILVVLPRGIADNNENNGDESLYPESTNFMFQAAYNGVTPYAEQIINGNFTFKNPEYKLLIYYVLADDFLDWDIEAQDITNKTFISNALDFLGPSSNNYEHDVENRMENYTLQNVVNLSSYVSECDFYEVQKTGNSYYSVVSDENGKCNSNKKNVVADVANGSSKGITLLYGSGGIEGYFTYDDVKEYSLEKVGWVTQILSEYDSDGDSSNNYSEMIKGLFKSQNIDIKEVLGCTTDYECENLLNDYADQMEFKLKYDLALLGRIKKINYNTLLDINNSSNVTTGITTISDVNKYSRYLEGDKSVNNGNYITFTTSEGFVIDRGNIVMGAGEDLLFNTNLLEQLTNMDACTNKTLEAYFTEALATYGIVIGGIAVGVGAAVLAVGAVGTIASSAVALATVGMVSLSVPGIGWVIGGALLLVAGIAALAYGVTTKKAINDTSSANYCEIFKEALNEIIDSSYIKMPVYSYEIPKDSDYQTTLCYYEWVEGKGCGTYDDNGNFNMKESIPLFENADRSVVNQLSSLTGSPSIRLYSNGKLVDEIYGASSAQYVYAIMDSWGVTSATNMKFYTGVTRNSSNEVNSIDIYDLLYTKVDRDSDIVDARYCVSEKYGQVCSEGKQISGLSYSQFGSNGKYTIPNAVSNANYMSQIAINSAKSSMSNNILDFEASISSVRNVVSTSYNYVPVNGSQITFSDGNSFDIRISDTYAYLYSGDEQITLNHYSGSDIYSFEYNNEAYLLNVNRGVLGEISGYDVKKNLTYQDLDDIKVGILQKSNVDLFENNVELFFEELKNKLNSFDNSDNINSYIDSFAENMSNQPYYTANIDLYVNTSITERNKETGQENITTSSVKYKTVEITWYVGNK